MKELIRCYKKQKIAGFTPEELKDRLECNGHDFITSFDSDKIYFDDKVMLDCIRNYYKINGKKVKKGTSSNKQLNCVKYRRELGFPDWKETRYCPECHLRALELLKEGKLSLV